MKSRDSRSFRVIQVTDSHLSDARPYFLANWRFCVEAMASLGPDLVIHTGDLCLDAVANSDELDATLAEMTRTGTRWRAVPGNHDVGDLHDRQIDPREWLEAPRREYRKRFGDDWWVEDHAGWRFIGLNSQLIGTGLAAEHGQFDSLVKWLEESSHQIAVFLHKPLFLRDPQERTETWACIRPALRARYIEAFNAAKVRLVASGHLHSYRNISIGGTSYVWAPSTAFIFNDGHTEHLGGSQSVGFIEYSFSEDYCSCVLHQPRQLIRHDVTGWLQIEGGNGYAQMAAKPFPY